MSGEDSVRRGSNQSADVVSTATSAAPEGDLAKLIGLLPALREAVQNGEVDDTLRAIDARQKFLRWSRLPEYIVLLRHGQSEGNVNQNIYTTKGDAQLELTPRGMEQAKNAGARLAKVIGDRNVFVAVSPFERAVQTLYGLFEGGFPRQQVDVIHHDPRLREQEFGNFQSIGLSAAVKAEMKAVGRFYYRRPNAESSADVFDRISAFWDALLSGGPTSLLQDRPKQFGACLLVTHGLTIRLLLMSIFQWSVETFESVFNIGNCEHITLRRNAHLFCYEFCASYSNPSRLPWATRNIWIRNRSADPNTPEVQVLRQRIAKLEEAREALPQDGWQRIDDVLDALHLELHKLCLQPYTVLDYLNIKAPQTAHKERALQMATAGHVCGQPDELLKKPRFLSSENESRIDFDSIEVDWWENVQSFKGRRLHMHNAERLCESLDTTPGGRAPLRRDTLRELRQDERCASSALRTRKPIIDTRRPRASASLQYSDPSRSDMRRTLDRQYGSMYTKEDMAAFGTESGDEEMLYFNRSCNWNGSDSPSTPNSPDSIYSPTDTVSLPTAARLVRPVPESPPRYPGTGGPSVADAAEEAIADAVGLLGEKVQSMSVEAAGAPGQPHP
eukprot:TRINITY_DN9947_c0_g1_i1.p1 TRINITY_DN9947_c0_g1~~TRINITY_DN9947_c0_g1_i1.p1  ORF type:complete len:616 (+),score=161.68 TRINITY_DN9947_c0_g1_i1:82-1929(+)